MKILSVDFDKTITKEKYKNYKKESIPNQPVIEWVNKQYDLNYCIIIHTARKWEDARDIVCWLIKHKVRWHGLRCEKLSADKFIDDKNIWLKGVNYE